MEECTWYANSDDRGGGWCSTGLSDSGGLRSLDDDETLSSLTCLSVCTDEAGVCSIGTLQDDIGVDIGERKNVGVQTYVSRSEDTYHQIVSSRIVHGRPTWIWAETTLKRVAPRKRASDEERILTYYCRASECSIKRVCKQKKEEKTLLDAEITRGIMVSLYLRQGMDLTHSALSVVREVSFFSRVWKCETLDLIFHECRE
jgi:hypothetical protein